MGTRPPAICLASLLALLALISAPAWAETVLVEAENLELTGEWNVVKGSKVVHGYILSGAQANTAPAAGAVDLPHAGAWRLWVRSRDFPDDRPGIRYFTVRVGNTRSTTLFGKHGRPELEGWAWEDGGTFDLPAGPNLIVIGEESTPYARCDALILTDDPEYKPKGPPWALRLPAAKTAPLAIAVADGKGDFLPAPFQTIEQRPLATIGNELLRISFHRCATANGNAVAMQAAICSGGDWQPVHGDAGSESYRVLFRPPDSDPKIASSSVYPTWDVSFAPIGEASAGGASVKTRLGTPTAPWSAGQCSCLRPASVRQLDSQTAELDFPELPVGQLTARWHMASGQPCAEAMLRFTPKQAGHFSLGYHGLVAAPPDKLDFLLLPFMFHGRRFPERPMALLNALTPTPLSLVNRDGVSYAVVAEPSELPFEWADPNNSRYAFGIRNEQGEAQPFLYSPVFGQPGSLSDGAAPIVAKFRVWIEKGNWYEAYCGIVRSVFHLADYRRPTYASLSDAVLNIFDLLRNDKASAWDAQAKGPWQIESKNTVTHASPLTYLSYYLLTGDEDFYRRYTLPTLEFLLSRPGAHFGARRDLGGYTRLQPLRGPVSLYGATVFAGAYEMTGGRTPAFGELCLTEEGQPRPTSGYSHIQPFEDALALYYLTREKKWLDLAVQGADDYVAKHIKLLPAKDLGPRPFINISFMPDWEGLLHMYEATGERRFLDAAAEGARWLLTTLWTQPPIPDGDVTIHPGGEFGVSKSAWWYGDRRYRLGVFEGDEQAYEERLKGDAPAAKLPERRVPAWQVSNVGLGLEQPCTYTSSRKHRNIMMSVWAPNLLRLYRLTDDDLFRTAARNATIGRCGNYPGYYLIGHTDQEQRPDYPLKGPDVTFIYYHHIPPFAAYIMDYLFTDAEVRSNGEVAFPWVRQFGYAWFDSRLRGHAPGKVYGQTAWPWLHRTAATVDTINVDRILAHGDGMFHVILLNQVREPQPVRVTFDESVLGRSVDGATAQVWMDNKPSEPLAIKGNSVSLTLSPLGIAALTLDGVKIDVPTHRAPPPTRLALPSGSSIHRVPIPGTKLEALETEICVPPFAWRDLYVYVTAGMDDCREAVLRYRVGDGPEREIKDDSYPWEFSVRVNDMNSPISWQIDISQ